MSITLSDEVFLILLGLLVLLAGILLSKLIRRTTNALEWEDLVATNGKLNAYKIGWWIGALAGLFINVWMVYTMLHPDPSYFSSWLMFLAGTAVGTGMARSFRPRDPDSSRRDVDDPDRR